MNKKDITTRMRYQRYINLILMMVCVSHTLQLTSCTDKKPQSNEYNMVVYTPKYASGFKVYGAEGKKSVIIESLNPWQGADSVSTKLFVRRDNEAIPAGFEGQVLSKIPERIITMSSTQIAILDAIGQCDRVAGVSGINFISNEKIQARRNRIPDVGYEGNVNYELIMSANPDLVMLYGVNMASPLEGKLKELGIPYIYIGEYLEESPLGKVEWVNVFGEITGEQAAADSTLQYISTEYNELAEKVKSEIATKPKVMINMPYADSWFMPSTNNYMIRLITDAGGDYIYKKNSGNSSVAIDIEEAYRLTSEADVWLNTGTVQSKKELKNSLPKFADMGIIKRGEVYNNNKKRTPMGGNDFYESGTMNPHVILKDLVSIFHPELLTDTLTYYQKLN